MDFAKYWVGGSAAGYQIDRSLRFNDDDSAYLSKVFASAGDRQKWTWSGWAKRSTANNTTNLLFYAETSVSAYTQIGWSGDNFQLNIAYSGTSFAIIRAAAESRDVSAWAHYVVVYDSANATSTDRMILYINGARVTDFATSSFPNQNELSPLNANTTHYIGTRKNVNQYFDGYLAEVHFVDGQALTPTDFGEYDADTGVWNPIRYAGTHGTNGFKLDFSDNTSTTTVSQDSSANNNDFTANNISVTAGADNDSLEDTPTNNFCTMNALAKGTDATLSNGSLDVAYGSSSTRTATIATMGMSSGKWYWEHTLTSEGAEIFGIVNVSDDSPVSNYPGFSNNGWGIYGDTGQTYHNGSAASYGSAFATNDVIGCAFDADNGKIWWSKNGTFFNSGDPAAGTNAAFSSLASDTYFPAIGDGGASGTYAVSMNFGQRAFDYTPPTGFKALNTANLPDPTIADGSTAMDALLYTGNGSTQTITGLNFSPDLLWIKNRSASFSHALFDKLRVSDGSGGDVNGASKELYSDQNAAQSNLGYVTLTNDGFTLGVADSSWNAANNYVAWSWDAGTSTVTNTDGTHSAQVRANSSTGFSVSTHSRTTAASISTWGHGLSAAPEFAILKPYNGAYNWIVWHKSMGNRKRIFLNSSSAGNSYSFDVWSSSSTTLGVYGNIIAGGGTALDCVTYAWTPIEGYSKFGPYVGNANVDGPFVYLGFRPAYVLIKNINQATNWTVYDSKREGFNFDNDPLYPNLTSIEGTTNYIDLLSNGFKIRNSHSSVNGSGHTLIYAAFAENPFKTARAR